MNIKIRNCNNINLGEIEIIEGCLNIKYAINGTGKSTIARAIELANDQNQLQKLTPYKYLSESPLSPEHSPSIECSRPIQSISIFNEEHVNQYMFLPNELVANSFEIFIKTADYDARMCNIQNMIQNIQTAFKDNPDLEQLITELTTFISGFGKAQNGYSKTGSIGKGLARGNKIIHIPSSLLEYTPYIQCKNNTSWLTWQNKGEDFLDVAEQCPYCAEKLSISQKEIVKQVAVEYDSKYVAELQKMISVLQSLDVYFTDSVKETINSLATSRAEFSKEEINFLKEIKEQVIVLNEKLIEIRSLNFETLKDVGTVIVALQNKRIELTLLGHINSAYTNEKVSVVNDALQHVIDQASQLEGEINQQNRLIQNTIQKHSQKINGFLESAGYNYQVSIIEDPNKNTYQMVLLSTDTSSQINDVKLHLSYGERNAFALVLFMYKSLKANPDLIILDDPISSFDKNKKYAIMEILFQGSGSLQGKTIIMLTHDFDPIVDLIHTLSIRCRFNPVPVASFLYNKNYELIEKDINPSDIQSFFEVANANIRSDINEINKLIYLRRRLDACGDKTLAWQLLSNVFHPDRTVPTIQDHNGERDMTVEEIRDATAIIKQDIPDFAYDQIYSTLQDTAQMVQLYSTITSNYEKVQLYRIINRGKIKGTVFKKFVDEVYHIENDNIFQLNPSQYPTIPDYIVQLCDKHIAQLTENLNLTEVL